MASRRPTKRKPRRGRASLFPDSIRLPRMPRLDEQQLDLLGLGLVALAAFFAFVFYFGWDGGKVGELFEKGFIYLFGGVGYLAPVAMFGTGAVLVMRQVLPSVKPFKAGAACLLSGLMLGLAAESFGLGPHHPARSGYFKPEYFKHHGGIVGDAMYAVTKTLIQQFGTDILFLFLMLAGALLFTGASVAGIVRATSESVTATTRRVRQSTSEFTALVTGRPPSDAASQRRRQPDPAEPPEVEPVVRATHVEAPALDGERRFPDLYGAEAADDDDADTVDEAAESELEDDVNAGVAAVSEGHEPRREELTPMGNRRSNVTEADDLEYSLPSPGVLKRSNGGAKVDTTGQARTSAQLV
ncbi:MAG TPA: DNA translocase FtsK 4TM domain-containing protein, partial [Thermoleophilaceae bacterium]|nr:DNA translocase FtsK 4TM domain-containing protein [Thermoleophilaceae bacterium]